GAARGGWIRRAGKTVSVSARQMCHHEPDLVIRHLLPQVDKYRLEPVRTYLAGRFGNLIVKLLWDPARDIRNLFVTDVIGQVIHNGSSAAARLVDHVFDGGILAE